MLRPRPALLPTLVALCLAVACSDAPSTSDAPSPAPNTSSPTAARPAPGTQVGIPDPDAIDPARLDPLAGMPACPSPPAAAGADPGDVPLPLEAVVTRASVDGPLRSVQGYVPRTPVEVMVDYLRRDGVEVAAAEDEVFESEVLLVADDLRVFVKAQASCARGSAFVLFASDDPDLVPVPAGTGP